MISGSVQPNKLFTESPVRPSDSIAQWGSTVVVAPHADDESLGCGGAIAALRLYNLPVHVLFVSDGTMSHPRSKKYPADTRRAIREQEALQALNHLGVHADCATFLRLPDTKVPRRNDEEFINEASRISDYLNTIQPQTILVPWRRDPHCDHRAAWELCDQAVQTSQLNIQWREYPIWVWELAKTGDLPHPEEGTIWQLDIQATLAQKTAAIAAHISQTTRLIDDDPEGFILTPTVLAHFIQPYEVYIEPN